MTMTDEEKKDADDVFENLNMSLMGWLSQQKEKCEPQALGAFLVWRGSRLVFLTLPKEAAKGVIDGIVEAAWKDIIFTQKVD